MWSTKNVLSTLVLFFFSFLRLISASTIIFETHVRELPIIVLHYSTQEQMRTFTDMTIEYHRAASGYTLKRLHDFMRAASVRCPGICFITNQDDLMAITPVETMSRILRSVGMSEGAIALRILNHALVHDHPCHCGIYENRQLLSIHDWKESVNVVACLHFQLPVNVSRSSIVTDAVASYRAFERIPYMAPYKLFHRNILVNFIGEFGLDAGGLLREFFSVFFQQIIESSGLFTLNSHGYVVISPGRTSLEDLAAYEAFGFYLAKSFQNNNSIGFHFSTLITQMIKFGKSFFDDLIGFETWDPHFASSLRALATMPDEDLRDYNFNDINPKFPSIVLKSSLVALFSAIKVQNYINSNFRAQLLMICLGFARACPVHLLAKSNIDLNSALLGSTRLTADALIEAIQVKYPAKQSPAYGFLCEWLRQLGPRDLMQMFRFVTGMKVVPPGNLAALNISLVLSAEETEHKLPQANTCNKVLILPPYKNREAAFEKLNILRLHISTGDAFEFGFR